MLDTVKLQSPYLEASVASRIRRQAVRRSAEDLGTGELLYELTTASLKGSWDSRVSLRVMREEWVPMEARVLGNLPIGADGRPIKRAPMVLRPSEPYVLLEGSVHKALMGHNVYGGPEGLQASCEWLCADVGDRLGVELPGGSEWLVRRADWAECYELPDFEAVEEYVWGLNSAEYPRRSVARYGRESIFSGGRTSAVKAYHKGLEFAKHDRKRLKSLLEADDLDQLQHLANRLVRWEISVKAPKLDADHSGKPSVRELSADYLRDLHYREVRRLVREGEAEVKTVRKQKQVRDRLLEVYDRRKAGLLLGTWHQLVTLGEQQTRDVMRVPDSADPHRTFRRHKQLLIAAGVSWIGSDVVILPTRSSLPDDFSPTVGSPYRIAGEADTVRRKLAPYRAA